MTTMKWIARMAGLLLGMAVAAGLVASWRLPRGTGALGADVKLLAAPIGELDVSPIGPLLSVTNLRAGSPPGRGETAVRNQTGATLSVRVRATPSLPDLDDLLVIRLELGDERLFEGTLSRLRSGTDRSFRLESGERRVLRAEAWLPDAVAGGYEGRVTDVGLEFEADVFRS